MKPNIIFITCHDLGNYLGCYGTPVPTPNIDRLAEDGILFKNHFSAGAICSPSRASIVTGCYPHTNGMMGLVHRGWELDTEKCRPLPAILKENGYKTHLFGFQHEHWDPFRLGYEIVHDVKSMHCDEVTPAFIEWLEQGSESSKPFFAALGFSEVHRMSMNPSHFKHDSYEPSDPKDVEVRPYLPDIPELRSDLADFYGAIKLVDKMVGKIMDAVHKNDIRRNTLIVFTTDHGASFMHSKATLYDGGTQTALVMSYEGVLPSHKIFDSLTSHVDILPTILDYLGIPIPEYVEGISLKKMLSELKDSASGADKGAHGQRQYVFAEENYNNHFNPSRMVRSHQYKYIRNGLDICIFDFLIPEIELSTIDFRKNRAVFDFYSTDRCSEELYDLEKDPGEMNNVAKSQEYTSILEELRNTLNKHMEETKDPFRNFRNEIKMPEKAYTLLRKSREE